MKILVPDHYNQEYLDKIKEVSPEIEIDILTVKKDRPFWLRALNYLCQRIFIYSIYKKIKSYILKSNISLFVNGEPADGHMSDAEVLLASYILDSVILNKLLPRLPKLKWIHSEMTGVEHIWAACTDLNGIILTNPGNVHSKRIAEFTLSLILSLSKRLPEHTVLQRKRQWEYLASKELRYLTVGIIGLGSIGSEFAKLAKALGMQVFAMVRGPKNNNNVDRLFYPEQLEELLKLSDYVILSCSLTKETRGIIGEKQLRSMKKDAYLINMARGALIREDALLRALKEKWIRGACLDIFEEQPLPLNSPFYKLNNVIITHHSAFYSEEALPERFNVFLVNLARYIKNKPLINKINPDKVI